MQSRTAPPRDHLTEGQVDAVLGALNVQVDAGLELASDDGWVDISDDLRPEGSEVSRNVFATIHGTCRLRLSRQLDWGAARVRPFMTLTAGGVEARFNLGVFLTSTPDTSAGESPQTWDVEGYDLLEVLAHPHGETVRVASGDDILAAVSTLILAAVPDATVQLGSAGESPVMPSDKLYPLDEQTTTLHIVNDLLGLAGWQALWADQDGRFRSGPYTSPADRGSEHTYDTSHPKTTVGLDRNYEQDFFDVPNRFVFVRDDPGQDLPEVGDGLYVVDNVSDGLTSQAARGRIITRVMRLDAASHAALVTQADRMVESDKRIISRYRATTAPMPLHMHMDVVTVLDDVLGLSGRFLSHEWTLPLDGSPMRHNLRAV